MAKLYVTVNKQEFEPDYYFHCPGCGCDHGVWTTGPEGKHPMWGFNGSLDKPTFTPSIKVTWPYKEKMNVCHSFIRNGKIEYLADCTHALAGNTVNLSDFEPTQIPQP